MQNPVVAVVDDKVAVNRKCGAKVSKAQKKAIDKPKPKTIVEISSGEEEKAIAVSGRKSRERSLRKEVKTLTAILTARSKVIGHLLLPSVLRYFCFFRFWFFWCVY
jgi:predicted Ser/Thr protein kinase